MVEVNEVPVVAAGQSRMADAEFSGAHGILACDLQSLLSLRHQPLRAVQPGGVAYNRIDVAGALYPCAGVYAVAEATGTIRKGDSVSLA